MIVMGVVYFSEVCYHTHTELSNPSQMMLVLSPLFKFTWYYVGILDYCGVHCMKIG